MSQGQEHPVQGIEGSLELPDNYEEILGGFKDRITLMRHRSAAPTKEQTDYLLAIAGLRDRSEDEEYRKQFFPGWASGWSRKHFEKLDLELRECINSDQDDLFK